MMPVHSETFIDCIQVGDYFIPALTLPRSSNPIGKWWQFYREFLKKHHPLRCNALILSGQLWRPSQKIESSRSHDLGRRHKQYLQLCRRDCAAGMYFGGRNNMNVLKELWYSSLEPSEFNSFPDKEYKEQLYLVGRNEKRLLSTMIRELLYVY